jgi:hypothetical protein
VSKQSAAKIAQDYVPKCIPSTCGNCRHFLSDIEERVTYGYAFKHEKNLRCGIGWFAVKKMGTCTLWSGDPTAEGKQL